MKGVSILFDEPVWYFPLAEERKKRKTFSHTQLGPDNIRVLRVVQAVYSTFLLLLAEA